MPSWRAVGRLSGRFGLEVRPAGRCLRRRRRRRRRRPCPIRCSSAWVCWPSAGTSPMRASTSENVAGGSSASDRARARCRWCASGRAARSCWCSTTWSSCLTWAAGMPAAASRASSSAVVQRRVCARDECVALANGSARAATLVANRGSSASSGTLEDLGDQRAPAAVVLHADQHLAVAGRVRVVGRDGGVAQSHPRGLAAGVHLRVERVAHPLDRGVEHRHVDGGALTGAPPAQQCGQHRLRGVHARRRCRRSGCRS